MARLWRRLAEFRTWKPLADSASLRDVLESLGYREPSDDVTIEDWLASVQIREHGPPLIRAGRTARDWLNRRQATDSLSPDGIFLAACLWRQSGFGRTISLPFWSAPTQRHHRLTLQVGQGWLAEFLDCVAEAARMAAGELIRLQQVEENGRRLARTARSRLPAALNSVLRAPIVTVRDLAKDLDVTPQAALSLLRQLLDAEIVREATGRASWRAFATF